MIIATLLEPDLASLQAAVREFEEKADAFEVRLDAFKQRPTAHQVRSLTRKPLVASCRRPADGGTFTGAEEERLGLLDEATKAGFDYVDLEDGTQLPVPEPRLIRSQHDYRATPPAEEIVRRGKLAARNGATFKFASRVLGLPDTLELLKATRILRAEGVPCTIMGLGPFPRALAHLVGSVFVYGGARQSAPGQPRLDEIRSTLARWRNPLPQPELYLVVGSPIDQSLSPRLHNTAFQRLQMSSTFGALEVRTKEELVRVVAAAPQLGLRGLSVTMPLKIAAHEISTRLTPEAVRARAVNCLRVDDGDLVGHNTDAPGAAISLRRLLERDEPRRRASRPSVLLLGTGGAARAVLSAVTEVEFTVAGRNAETLAGLAAEFGAKTLPLEQAPRPLRHYEVLINATAIERPLPIDGYAGRLFDLHYGDAPTAWEAYAKAKRLPFVGGRDLLHHQGVLAFEFWTGRKAPADDMANALGVRP